MNKRIVLPICLSVFITLLVLTTIIILKSPVVYHAMKGHAASLSTYYVSPTGSDTNDGSQTSPFATMQKAASQVQPGTTVHVLPGTYSQKVIINTSGTAQAPITFLSDTKWGAKIKTGGTLTDFPVRNNGSYIHFIDFDVTSSTAWAGILTYGTHNLFQGNHVHDLTAMACNGSPGGQGLGDDASASLNTFDGNVVNNIGSYPTACSYVHGIYVDGVGDIVTNNITYNNVGNGLYCNHESGPLTFANNLTFANAEYGIGINSNGVSLDGFIIENNIVIENALSGINTWAGANGIHNEYNDNLFFNNGKSNYTLASDPWNPSIEKNTITADPQFINYQANGSGDYHLKSTSPAIDAGILSNAPSIDYDKQARPKGNAIDIGPFEYGAITSAPTIKVTQTPIASSIQTTKTITPDVTIKGAVTNKPIVTSTIGQIQVITSIKSTPITNNIGNQTSTSTTSAGTTTPSNTNIPISPANSSNVNVTNTSVSNANLPMTPSHQTKLNATSDVKIFGVSSQIFFIIGMTLIFLSLLSLGTFYIFALKKKKKTENTPL